MLLQGVDNRARAYEDNTVYSFDELEKLGFLFNPEIQVTDTITLMDDGGEVNFGSMAPSILPDLNTNNNYAEGAAFPARYDLRQEGCMTSVKDQGSIGSCWAHATYASLESAIKKASASSSVLSADGLSQAGGDASGIELSQDGMILPLGSTHQLLATLMPYGNDSPVVWSSSNNLVASVSAHGLVTTHGMGNVYITASTDNGAVFAECSITVTDPAALRFLTIDNQETVLSVGSSLLLEYALYPSNAVATDLIWKVDDTSVARVNEYGLLTALHSGTVSVTVSTRDGIVSAPYTIQVVGEDLFSSAITSSTLDFADSTLLGDLNVTVTSTQATSQECMVLAAFYSADGQLLSAMERAASLLLGDNTFVFSNITLSGIDTASVNLQIFVLDGAGSYTPLTKPCHKTIIQ